MGGQGGGVRVWSGGGEGFGAAELFGGLGDEFIGLLGGEDAGFKEVLAKAVDGIARAPEVELFTGAIAAVVIVGGVRNGTVGFRFE